MVSINAALSAAILCAFHSSALPIDLLKRVHKPHHKAWHGDAELHPAALPRLELETKGGDDKKNAAKDVANYILGGSIEFARYMEEYKIRTMNPKFKTPSTLNVLAGQQGSGKYGGDPEVFWIVGTAANLLECRKEIGWDLDGWSAYDMYRGEGKEQKPLRRIEFLPPGVEQNEYKNGKDHFWIGDAKKVENGDNPAESNEKQHLGRFPRESMLREFDLWTPAGNTCIEGSSTIDIRKKLDNYLNVDYKGEDKKRGKPTTTSFKLSDLMERAEETKNQRAQLVIEDMLKEQKDATFHLLPCWTLVKQKLDLIMNDKRSKKPASKRKGKYEVGKGKLVNDSNDLDCFCKSCSTEFKALPHLRHICGINWRKISELADQVSLVDYAKWVKASNLLQLMGGNGRENHAMRYRMLGVCGNTEMLDHPKVPSEVKTVCDQKGEPREPYQISQLVPPARLMALNAITGEDIFASEAKYKHAYKREYRKFLQLEEKEYKFKALWPTEFQAYEELMKDSKKEHKEQKERKTKK